MSSALGLWLLRASSSRSVSTGVVRFTPLLPYVGVLLLAALAQACALDWSAPRGVADHDAAEHDDSDASEPSESDGGGRGKPDASEAKGPDASESSEPDASTQPDAAEPEPPKTCTRVAEDGSCVCDPDYAPDEAQQCVRIDDCPAAACSGGECVDGIGDYACTCPPHYSGTGTHDCVPGFAQVAMSDSHACALRADGKVFCWGSNAGGKLGYGVSGSTHAHPGLVGGLSNVVQIAAGSTHTCARMKNGDVYCWGENGAGQLATGTTFYSTSPTTTLITGATDLSIGAATCAARGDQQAVCWGMIDLSGSAQPEAVYLTGSQNITRLANGACGVMPDASLRCWDDVTKVPVGTTSITAQPAVAGTTDVTHVGSGRAHHCVRKSDSTVWCWGTNVSGQLGVTSTASASTPVYVENANGALALAVARDFTCIIRADRTVSCWGNGPGPTWTHTQVGNLAGAVQLAVSGYGVCALKDNHTIGCAGRNDSGQLGNGLAESTHTYEAFTITAPAP